MIRVAVIGSRGYDEREDEIHKFIGTLPNDAVIISGGAVGVDLAAEEAARERGLSVEIIRPDYEKYNKNPKFAPIARNSQVVETADVVVAFWDGKSRGTADTMKKAIDSGKLWKVNP